MLDARTEAAVEAGQRGKYPVTLSCTLLVFQFGFLHCYSLSHFYYFILAPQSFVPYINHATATLSCCRHATQLEVIFVKYEMTSGHLVLCRIVVWIAALLLRLMPSNNAFEGIANWSPKGNCRLKVVGSENTMAHVSNLSWR